MAAPLLAVLAILGAAVGYLIQFHPPEPSQSPKIFCVVVLMLPALMITEKLQAPEAPVFKVVSSIEIQAPPPAVWNNVISFSELPPPDEFIFRMGIAYPMRATIQGQGPGAVRHCVFSTGSFVEPIEIWEAPDLLRFSVLQNPAPMQEWTPYDEIHPPHLEGFFLSRKGQFRLIKLSNNRTLLEGTTWYTHRLWPQAYWRFWSDYVIHQIHGRVLKQIKRCSETHACV
jgi:hypothetical protein